MRLARVNMLTVPGYNRWGASRRNIFSIWQASPSPKCDYSNPRKAPTSIKL